MGNEKSFIKLPPMIKFVGFTKHPRYGQGNIYSKREKLIFEKVMNDKNLSILEIFTESPAENCVLCYGYKYVEKTIDNWFQNEQKINAYFEFIPSTLRMELENRIVLNMRFSEPEIYNILYNVAKTGLQLKNRNLIIGNISLENIFVTNEKQIKVLPSCIFQDELDPLIKLKDSQSKYVDPSIAEFSSKHQNLPPILMFTCLFQISIRFYNDVYALAVVLLQLLSLTIFSEYSQLKDEIIDQVLLQASNYYSNHLIKIIKLMIFPILKFEKKISFEGLMEILGPYSEQILKFEPFAITKQKDIFMFNEGEKNSHKHHSKKEKPKNEENIQNVQTNISQQQNNFLYQSIQKNNQEAYFLQNQYLKNHRPANQQMLNNSFQLSPQANSQGSIKQLDFSQNNQIYQFSNQKIVQSKIIRTPVPFINNQQFRINYYSRNSPENLKLTPETSKYSNKQNPQIQFINMVFLILN